MPFLRRAQTSSRYRESCRRANRPCRATQYLSLIYQSCPQRVNRLYSQSPFSCSVLSLYLSRRCWYYYCLYRSCPVEPFAPVPRDRGSSVYLRSLPAPLDLLSFKTNRQISHLIRYRARRSREIRPVYMLQSYDVSRLYCSRSAATRYHYRSLVSCPSPLILLIRVAKSQNVPYLVYMNPCQESPVVIIVIECRPFPRIPCGPRRSPCYTIIFRVIIQSNSQARRSRVFYLRECYIQVPVSYTHLTLPTILLV